MWKGFLNELKIIWIVHKFPLNSIAMTVIVYLTVLYIHAPISTSPQVSDGYPHPPIWCSITLFQNHFIATSHLLPSICHPNHEAIHFWSSKPESCHYWAIISYHVHVLTNIGRNNMREGTVGVITVVENHLEVEVRVVYKNILAVRIHTGGWPGQSELTRPRKW